LRRSESHAERRLSILHSGRVDLEKLRMVAPKFVAR
jgi:hypothetical protein